jgi:GGDEF domain-containing protein
MEVIVMYILEFLLEHYIMLAELIGLWLLMDSGIHLTKKTVLATRIVIILIFTESVLWSLELWTRSFETLSIARPILSSTIYLLHPAIMIGIIGMGDGIRKQKMWIHIPITISIPLIYTSQWTHLIFWYTEDNVYKTVNSFFRYYPYILFFFYAFALGIYLIENFSLFYRKARKGIFFTLVFSLMGVILHVVVDVDTDYSTLFASVLILYYLFLYMNTSKMDPLTGLMNRQCYYADSKKGRERISAVASVDMNDLKKINDTMGHKAGDEALQTVSRCLNFKRERAKNVYRIGGDEFAIFYYAKDEE